MVLGGKKDIGFGSKFIGDQVGDKQIHFKVSCLHLGGIQIEEQPEFSTIIPRAIFGLFS